ncbi:ABC transporter substrate-binding protein [uncultured Brevundimonas sp.]|uniref:ABC transporter substrate-binding protein n=1 Tax=uncultured Brevundimonas sp. TaxID=213418 RepID=UPI0030ED777F|tara:strand:- start:10732 stop:11763 length:1032 start_codon:yes stop_codon:yes gene_type:complete
MSRDQNRPFFISRRTVLAGALATAPLTACGRSEVPVDEAGRVRLRFATDWSARAEHGGFYQALAGGGYERRGLNVQIVQGAPDVDVPGLLASGAVELGIGSNSFIPMNLAAEGAPVKAVAAFFQKDPQALVAHAEPALKSIGDLKGRPIMLTGTARTTFWPWLKARYGFTDDQLRDYSADPAIFIDDRQAVLQGYLTSTPYLIEQAGGKEPKVFLLSDEDYPSYGSIVLAPNAFARDNATALRSFIAASAEGWRDYIHGDSRAADALIRQDNPGVNQALLDQSRDRLRDSGIVDGGDAALYGLGTMTDDRWRAFFEVAAEPEVYSSTLNWRDAFTIQYLPGRS